MSVIPCVGTLAIIPGIVAVILAVVGLTRATEQSRGLVIAALIIGTVAILFSIAQWFFIGKIADKKDVWKEDIESVLDDIKVDILDEIEKGDFSITIESGDEKVEIKTTIEDKKLQEKLEQLESGTKPDTLKK
jgi:NhaP-type Na+/H+ and K+/H+ antiporter